MDNPDDNDETPDTEAFKPALGTAATEAARFVLPPPLVADRGIDEGFDPSFSPTANQLQFHHVKLLMVCEARGRHHLKIVEFSLPPIQGGRAWCCIL